MKINWFKIKTEIINTILWRIVIFLGNKEKNHIIKNLIELLTYLRQGYRCNDCYKAYFHCKCNNFEDINDINKFISKWILYNLSKEHIQKLTDDLDDLPENFKEILELLRK